MLSLFPNENKQEAKRKTLQVIFFNKKFFSFVQEPSEIIFTKIFSVPTIL